MDKKKAYSPLIAQSATQDTIILGPSVFTISFCFMFSSTKGAQLINLDAQCDFSSLKLGLIFFLIFAYMTHCTFQCVINDA